MTLLACAVTTMVLAAACGGGDEEPEESSSDSTAATAGAGPTTTAPPTTVLTPEDEAEAAYLGFVDAVERLLTTSPDPDDAELVRFAIEPVLGRTRDNLSTMEAEHHIVQRGQRTSHRVMAVSLEQPDRAIVRDCYVGNDTRIDQDDGSVVSEGLSTRVLEATVVMVEGRWAVSDVGTQVLLDGEVPCPE